MTDMSMYARVKKNAYNCSHCLFERTNYTCIQREKNDSFSFNFFIFYYMDRKKS